MQAALCCLWLRGMQMRYIACFLPCERTSVLNILSVRFYIKIACKSNKMAYRLFPAFVRLH